MPRRVSVATMALENQPHALYRFFDRSDVLLYVGITADLPTRMKNHRKGKPWWTHIHNITVEHFDTRQEALDAERKAIREEKPLHNDQHNPHVWVTDLPDPRKIDGRWLAENWRKVAPPIRDHVEMPAWQQGRLELADELLDGYSQEDLARFADEAKTYAALEGEDEPSGDDLRVRSAVMAFQEVSSEHWQLSSVLTELLRSALGDSYTTRLAETTTYIKERLGGRVTELDSLSWLAETVVHEADRRYFDALPDHDQQFWADVMMNSSMQVYDHEDLRRLAGHYARLHRQVGVTPPGICDGVGDGVMCVQPKRLVTAFTNCPYCAKHRLGPCAGHTMWCDAHVKEVASSPTYLDKEGNRLVISECREPKPELEVPF